MVIAACVFILVVLAAWLFYASYSISSGVYLKAICRIETDKKMVALTFDDGPDSVQTPKVLDVLRDRNVPATFFLIGRRLAGNEELVRRIDREGHHIGNHSYTHSGRFPLYPAKRIRRDLMHCQDILYKLLGKEIILFRPPFGVTNPPIARAVKGLGYTTVGWSIRTFDTQNPGHEKILSRIRKGLRPGAILLLHDRMPDSDVLLEKILDLLEAEGYTVGPAYINQLN